MTHKREHWGSRLGFVMAAAGSAIGLGTLWQFPYLIGQNGGGLFLIAYFVFTILIAIPVFVAELVIGRRGQRGAVGSFTALSKTGSNWKLVGWIGVLASFIVLSFYSVVAGWGLNYVLLSLTDFYDGKTPEMVKGVFSTLSHSGGIQVFWHLIFMLIISGVVYQGVQKGIEKWSRLMTSGLLIILVSLFCYSMTLDGLNEALHYLFYPDVSKLSVTALLEALGLSLFTLSLGESIMVTYGSYMKKTDDIPKVVGIVSIMNIIVSLLAALMIFPIVFTFGLSPQGGAGLVFETLPVLFAQLPGSVLLSTLFFVLLTFTAITSGIGLLETVIANCTDLYQWSRKKTVITMGSLIFIFGIPSALATSGDLFPDWIEIFGKNFFQTMGILVTNWLMPVNALCVSLFVGWRMKKKDVLEEYQQGSVWKVGKNIWYFAIRYIVPLAILLIIFGKTGIVNIDQLIR